MLTEDTGSPTEVARREVARVRRHPWELSASLLGTWWEAPWRKRLLRRMLVALPGYTHIVLGRQIRPGADGLGPLSWDLEFWRTVRREATPSEWLAWTRNSYVVLTYHRLAGSFAPGEDRMDVSPRRARRHLQGLRILGWRPLSPEEIISISRGQGPAKLRKRYVLTADDGFREAVLALSELTRHRPQVFVPTTAIGGTASWLGHHPIAGQQELQAFEASGGFIGGHAADHVPLDTLTPAELESQVSLCRSTLAEILQSPLLIFAYPHGRHDMRVRAALRRNGYLAGYTTATGRNGYGTDPYQLRRVEPKGWDDFPAFLWKVVTGESLPVWWEYLLRRRWRCGLLVRRQWSPGGNDDRARPAEPAACTLETDREQDERQQQQPNRPGSGPRPRPKFFGQSGQPEKGALQRDVVQSERVQGP